MNHPHAWTGSNAFGRCRLSCPCGQTVTITHEESALLGAFDPDDIRRALTDEAQCIRELPSRHQHPLIRRHPETGTPERCLPTRRHLTGPYAEIGRDPTMPKRIAEQRLRRRRGASEGW